MRLALVLAVLLTRHAAADTVYELPRSKARLELPDGWLAVQAPSLVAAYKHPGGSVLAVTRADVPNSPAWKDEAKVREAYADQIERGIRSKIAGYKRVARKLADANGVPALDLEATRDGGATVILRILLFRSYALALAIEVPAKGDLAIARAIAAKLTPPKE